MNFNQMFNSIYQNQISQQVRKESATIRQIWDADPHQRTFMKNNNPELAAALEKGDQKQLEKIIHDKLKAQMDAKKAEQERKARLMNADPNDVEAQKMIEEDLKKEMVLNNYMTAQEQFPEFFGSITMLYVDV